MDDVVPHLLYTAHTLIARNTTSNSTSTSSTSHNGRPPSYKIIGLSIAIASGLFIGTSFVLKKVGLLRANVKYNEEAGEGYGYLKNAYWWSGMTLMILGEICNFVAYAFTDAILVTPLGALSVVVTTILSAIFLKERLSFVGKIGCFNCIVGSIIIVMNAPEQSAVADIQEMKHFVIAPGFLSYAGVVIAASIFIALWVGPRYGKKSMFVYLSICSLIGGLSVVATQGLGAAVVAQAGKGNQFNQWFLYVLLVFVVATLLTEIIYLNKALNIFNAALVTPTYYVFFTSTTIITSAILFQGFHGTGISIATVVMGFLQICSGVVLLQLSKSAKDVPDAAIFKGDLDQVREVAEQEHPESEPKADAIRGTAFIIRRMSTSRQKMEAAEAKRLREEKMADLLEPVGENEIVEWDGLRRRKTIVGEGSTPSASIRRKTIHPPLGMSHIPTEEELAAKDESHFFDSLRGRASSLLHPARPQHTKSEPAEPLSPVQTVAMTDIKANHSKSDPPAVPYGPGSFEEAQEHIFGHPVAPSSRSKPLPSKPMASPGFPPTKAARRQFSFTNIFRNSRNTTTESEDLEPPRPPLSSRGSASSEQRKAMKAATEEERLGLVVGDSNRGLLESSPERAREPSPTSPSSELSKFPSLPDLQGQRQHAADVMHLPLRTSPSRKRAPSPSIPPESSSRPQSAHQRQPRQTLRKVTFSSDQQPDVNQVEPASGSGRPHTQPQADSSRRGTEESFGMGGPAAMTITPEQMREDDHGATNRERFAQQSAREREERRQKRQSYGDQGRSESQPPPDTNDGGATGSGVLSGGFI